MKTLTVELPEEVYERAERRAAKQGAALNQQIVEWVRQYGEVSTDLNVQASANLGVGHSDRWRQIIDDQLMEWSRNPAILEDEGVDAPTSATIARAIELAVKCRERGDPPPDSVVRDPNGSVVFRRRQGDISEAMHVWDDGNIEFCRFEGTRLVERRPL